MGETATPDSVAGLNPELQGFHFEQLPMDEPLPMKPIEVEDTVLQPIKP